MKRELLSSYNPQSIEEIYDILAEMHKVDKTTIKPAVSHAFGFIRENARNPKYAGVLLHGLGSFEVFEKIINSTIRLWIKAYREKKISRVITNNRLHILWRFRQLCLKNGRQKNHTSYVNRKN